jgi:hypothetical protein
LELDLKFDMGNNYKIMETQKSKYVCLISFGWFVGEEKKRFFTIVDCQTCVSTFEKLCKGRSKRNVEK